MPSDPGYELKLAGVGGKFRSAPIIARAKNIICRMIGLNKILFGWIDIMKRSKTEGEITGRPNLVV